MNTERPTGKNSGSSDELDSVFKAFGRPDGLQECDVVFKQRLSKRPGSGGMLLPLCHLHST